MAHRAADVDPLRSSLGEPARVALPLTLVESRRAPSVRLQSALPADGRHPRGSRGDDRNPAAPRCVPLPGGDAGTTVLRSVSGRVRMPSASSKRAISEFETASLHHTLFATASHRSPHRRLADCGCARSEEPHGRLRPEMCRTDRCSSLSKMSTRASSGFRSQPRACVRRVRRFTSQDPLSARFVGAERGYWPPPAPTPLTSGAPVVAGGNGPPVDQDRFRGPPRERRRASDGPKHLPPIENPFQGSFVPSTVRRLLDAVSPERRFAPS